MIKLQWLNSYKKNRLKFEQYTYKSAAIFKSAWYTSIATFQHTNILVSVTYQNWYKHNSLQHDTLLVTFTCEYTHVPFFTKPFVYEIEQ